MEGGGSVVLSLIDGEFRSFNNSTDGGVINDEDLAEFSIAAFESIVKSLLLLSLL